MTGIRLSIQPTERSGNSVSPKGPTAECCSVLLLQNALGQRSAHSLFTSYSILLYSSHRLGGRMFILTSLVIAAELWFD